VSQAAALPFLREGGKSELHMAAGSDVVFGIGGGETRRKVPQKIYRLENSRGKGEKVG
jgi:hypothetical protein